MTTVENYSEMTSTCLFDRDEMQRKKKLTISLFRKQITSLNSIYERE